MRRLRVSLARARPRLSALSFVYWRTDARPDRARAWFTCGAAALLFGRSRLLSTASRAQALGPELSRHLQYRPPANRRTAADRRRAALPRNAVRGRGCAISRGHRLARK